MGYLYFEQKSFDDALVCFNRALSIYKVIFGEKDDRIPILLNKLRLQNKFKYLSFLFLILQKIKISSIG